MKLSELVLRLVELWKEEGECEVYIDLLTENQSNTLQITGFDCWNKEVSIDCEIEDVDDFKNNLK